MVTLTVDWQRQNQFFLKKLEMEFSVNEIFSQDENILGKGSNASAC